MGEATVVSEWRALRRSGLLVEGGPAPGEARSVVLVQGFGMPARTVQPLGEWLTRGGWSVRVAPVGWNVACGEATVDVVVRELESVSATHGPPVLLGHSRGGLIARVAAVRHPHLVAGLITVCTPWALGPPDRPGVAAMTRVVRFARRHGMHAMGSIDCDQGPCCTAFRLHMGEVPTVPWAALWSSADTIGAEAAVPPAGPTRTVDLGTSHLGAVRSIAGWTAMADALRAFGLTASPGA